MAGAWKMQGLGGLGIMTLFLVASWVALLGTSILWANSLRVLSGPNIALFG